MDFINNEKINIDETIYKRFLNLLEKKIKEKVFLEGMKKCQEIDLKYYEKVIREEQLLNIVRKYKEKEMKLNENIKNIQILLPGNPEIVFMLAIEAIRNNLKMLIIIEDFCLAQNTMLIELINSSLKDMRLKEIIKLENQLEDEKIIQNSEKFDMTMCIGNSNDYNILSKKIKDLKFYPYNILEVYSDSDELEEIRKKIYDYSMLNQYEMEIYDMDFNIEDVIEEINRDGYGFCSVLFSRDKEKINKFKENVKSQYVIINENPFNKIKFEFLLG